jgi:hypothetical protein
MSLRSVLEKSMVSTSFSPTTEDLRSTFLQESAASKESLKTGSHIE